MKRTLFILAMILCSVMLSCKPQDEGTSTGGNGNNNTGDSNNVTIGEINGHGYVDLGLPSGLKWATRNVGAPSSDCAGDYFAWGETIAKERYVEENSLTYGMEMDDISGNPQYDAATANWGGSWRLPTKEEMNELFDFCEFVWDGVGENDGYKIIGPNGNFIFIPVVGYYGYFYGYADGYEGYYEGLMDENIGHYWLSEPGEPSEPVKNVHVINELAADLYFYYNHRSVGDGYRYVGKQIRPVSD